MGVYLRFFFKLRHGKSPLAEYIMLNWQSGQCTQKLKEKKRKDTTNWVADESVPPTMHLFASFALKHTLASPRFKKNIYVNTHTLGWLLLECLDAVYSQVMENSGHIES